MPMSEQKNTHVGAEVKSVKLEAVVTRADDLNTTTKPGKVTFTYGAVVMGPRHRRSGPGQGGQWPAW